VKAITIATLATLAVAGVITVAFRRDPQARNAGVMVKIFLGFTPLVVLAWLVTPASLGFLPRNLLAEPLWVDFVACLFFFATAFFGGLLQLYNLADRGLSLRVLAELAAVPHRSMTIEEIARHYSEGRGLGWMYDKRLDGLARCRLVAIDGGRVTLTRRGQLWAERLRRVREFLRLPGP
jgi:hypothetical protein